MYIQCEREEVKIILMKRIKKVVLAKQVQYSLGEGEKDSTPTTHRRKIGDGRGDVTRSERRQAQQEQKKAGKSEWMQPPELSNDDRSECKKRMRERRGNWEYPSLVPPYEGKRRNDERGCIRVLDRRLSEGQTVDRPCERGTEVERRLRERKKW